MWQDIIGKSINNDVSTVERKRDLKAKVLRTWKFVLKGLKFR